MGMIGNTPYQGLIDTGNIVDGAITAAKIKAAADLVSKLGYTPVNKAGDTLSGNLKVQVFGNATSSVQYGTGLEAKMNAYAAETNLELPSPSALFKIRSRAGALDTIGLTATYSGTERDGLLVDNLGRVSQPNQPMYSGKFGGSATQAGNLSPIKYDYSYVNVGSCYSASTGLFTAPAAGTYLALAQSLNNNAPGFLALQLVMGAGVVANSWSVTDNNANPLVQSMVMLQAAKTLAQGDTVYVSMLTSKATNYMAETYNTFTVIKIA